MNACKKLMDPLDEARSVLSAAQEIMVLTGAGISAESGVPTFRGEGGYWRNKSYEELASPQAFAQDPRLVWEWYLMRRQTVAACRPNRAHAALADWAAWRQGVTLLTQNVDGLHEIAGSAVVRLHGSLWVNRCVACGMERDDRRTAFEGLPMSPCCGALERPAIVWFGESLPREAVIAGFTAAFQAQAVLVVGTSGVVMPAAELVKEAANNQAIVIDVNTEDDAVPAHIKLRGSAADILPRLLA
jgi:NAD-dependent deacetylase